MEVPPYLREHEACITSFGKVDCFVLFFLHLLFHHCRGLNWQLATRTRQLLAHPPSRMGRRMDKKQNSWVEKETV